MTRRISAVRTRRYHEYGGDSCWALFGYDFFHDATCGSVDELIELWQTDERFREMVHAVFEKEKARGSNLDRPAIYDIIEDRENYQDEK